MNKFQVHIEVVRSNDVSVKVGTQWVFLIYSEEEKEPKLGEIIQYLPGIHELATRVDTVPGGVWDINGIELETGLGDYIVKFTTVAKHKI